MRWRNSDDHWGGIAISLHWLTALTVIALFTLGLWMVDLDFYDPWYNDAPHIHKSIGILLLSLTLLRVLWRVLNVTPQALSTHSQIERRAGHWVHRLLYLLLFSIMISGYLISTADGRGIEVFNWFEIPATLHGIKKQEDIAGVIHLWLASALIGLASLHALAAIKHHFIDKDSTLKRMLGL